MSCILNHGGWLYVVKQKYNQISSIIWEEQSRPNQKSEKNRKIYLTSKLESVTLAHNIHDGHPIIILVHEQTKKWKKIERNVIQIDWDQILLTLGGKNCI